MPGNYRGVHLTTILSKIAEKMISINLMPFLQHRAFGENQWAFTPTLSARDLVTTLVLSWILAVCAGKKSCLGRVRKPKIVSWKSATGKNRDFELCAS